jgi:hypothetical protein
VAAVYTATAATLEHDKDDSDNAAGLDDEEKMLSVAVEGLLAADRAPIGGLSGERAPIGGLPAERAPIGGLPAEITPFGGLPAERAPIGSLPAERARIGGPPAEKAPIGGLPAEEVPIGGMPAFEAPIAGLPAVEAHTGGMPADRVPIEASVGGVLEPALDDNCAMPSEVELISSKLSASTQETADATIKDPAGSSPSFHVLDTRQGVTNITCDFSTSTNQSEVNAMFSSQHTNAGFTSELESSLDNSEQLSGPEEPLASASGLQTSKADHDESIKDVKDKDETCRDESSCTQTQENVTSLSVGWGNETPYVSLALCPGSPEKG